MITDIVQLIGGDEPRIKEKLRWRFSVERTRTVHDEYREPRGFLYKRKSMQYFF